MNRVVDETLSEELEQVIAEARSAWPDREIQSELTLSRPIICDSARIAQMLSNLLANALTHGDPASPVSVHAHIYDSSFELYVSNRGEPIPPITIAHMFQPFSRATARGGQQGLGLGLYIASEIAHAHDGSLEIVSSSQETRFTFRMPITAV